MKKILLFLLTVVLFTSFVNAVEIGPFPQNQEIQIYQTCNNCTYCNFTQVKYPNSTNFLTDLESTQNDTYFFFNIAGGNITPVGKYTYCYNCGNTEEKETGCIDFNVTPSGKESSVSESILYSVFIVILLGLIMILVYFIIIFPSGNESDDGGHTLKIIKLKYLRIFFIALLYPLLIILLNLMNGLAYNFTTLSIFTGTIGFLFQMMLSVAWIFTLIMALWIIYLLIHDTNISKNMTKLGRMKING